MVLHQPLPIFRERFLHEALLVQIHVEEPAEQQVVVELLAEERLAPHRVERHQQRRLEQPLRRNRGPTDRAVHLVEHSRQLPQRRVRQLLQLPQRMLLRHRTLRLPAVSFLKARAFEDGQAGYSDPLAEQRFVVGAINRLQARPEWRETPMIIAYDDSDGWYDHVMPPIVSQSNT